MAITTTTIEKALDMLSKLYMDNAYTLDQISEQSGVGRTTVYNYCNKRVKSPSIDTMERIASVYGYSVSALLALDGTPLDPETQEEINTLEQQLADERDVAQNMEIDFKRRMRELRRENEEMSGKFSEIDTRLDIAIREFQTASRDKRVLFICFVVVVILLIIVMFYAGFAYFAFDVADTTKGIYRG